MADDNLSILDVEMECPKCYNTCSVFAAEPDIDGEGSLGCPDCLALRGNKVVMREIR